MRKLVIFLSLMVSFIAVSASAQQAKFQAGTHYYEIGTPLRTLASDKVEVAELFAYSCPHCYTFESIVSAWKKGLPENTTFIRVPGTWGKEHAQFYYTMEMLNVLDKAHGPAFSLIHNDPSRSPRTILTKESEMAAFLGSYGVTEDAFKKEYKGASVKMAMSFADSNIRSLSAQMAKQKVNVGTPSIVVNGKYYVSLNKAVPQFQAMLEVVNFLIAKESVVAQ